MAPDWGWFVQKYGDHERWGEFGTAKAVVDALLAHRDGVALLRPDAWIELPEVPGVRYLDPEMIADLPSSYTQCPKCQCDRSADYDAEDFIGMTMTRADGCWTEVWLCLKCKTNYRTESTD